MKGKTIQSESGCVVVHVELPPHLMKWAVKHARDQGHEDVSQVLRAGIGLLMARHEAKSASA
jgi:hypothetical protein